MWQFQNIPTVLHANVRKAIRLKDVNYLRDVTIRYNVKGSKGCNCGANQDLLNSYKAAQNEGLFDAQIHRAT